MSNVVKFPTLPLRPDLARCREAIALCAHDPSMLLFVAHCGTAHPTEDDPIQAIINRWGIAFCALAELLGVPDVAEALL